MKKELTNVLFAPIAIPFDATRWIPVPVDFRGVTWRDAEEWASWLARDAQGGRKAERALMKAVREAALEVALFPAEHVSFRFWHYPEDGVPSGFADIYVQARIDDGARPEDLLPESGMTAVTPVIDEIEVPSQRAAVRRLSLGVTPRPGTVDEPMLVPKGEWLGIAEGWVTYLVSVDYDPAQFDQRRDDLDSLFSGIATSEVGRS